MFAPLTMYMKQIESEVKDNDKEHSQTAVAEPEKQAAKKPSRVDKTGNHYGAYAGGADAQTLSVGYPRRTDQKPYELSTQVHLSDYDHNFLRDIGIRWDKSFGIGDTEQKAALDEGKQRAVKGVSLPAQPKIDPWISDKLKEKNKSWMETTRGRLAIRAFSRGVLGSVFYAVGSNIYSKSFSEKRDEDGKLQRKDYDGTNIENVPLRALARTIDIAIGKPIEKVFGENAVRFRDTRDFEYKDGKTGRTLGHEVVHVTFNFAMASIGDALGREIAGLFDPNVKTKWMKDGKVTFPEAVKYLTKSTWKILSFNQGEDWAVALPYVYFMKAQRQVLNKMFPGFKYDFDYDMNGGSYKIDDDGRIVGNYQAAGALDLQSRFTFYNIGTLMFRKTYNILGENLVNWKDSGFTEPLFDAHKHPKGKVGYAIDQAKDLVRFLYVNTIKGVITMTPTVPFYSFFRVPQSKYRGLAISGNKGIYYNDHRTMWKLDANGKAVVRTPIQTKNGDIALRYEDTLRADNYMDRDSGPAWPVKGTFPGKSQDEVKNPFASAGISSEDIDNPEFFNPYYLKDEENFYANDKRGQRFFNSVGKATEDVAGAVFAGMGHAERIFRLKPHDKKFEEDSKVYLNSALAYTPYFMAKTEFAHWFDNTAMTHALNKTYDGLTSFSPGEFAQGVSEAFKAALHKTEGATEVGASSPFAAAIEEQRADRRALSFVDRTNALKRAKHYSNILQSDKAGDWKGVVAKAVEEKESGVTIN